MDNTHYAAPDQPILIKSAFKLQLNVWTFSTHEQSEIINYTLSFTKSINTINNPVEDLELENHVQANCWTWHSI